MKNPESPKSPGPVTTDLPDRRPRRPGPLSGSDLKDRQEVLHEERTRSHSRRADTWHQLRPELLRWSVRAWVPVVLTWAALTRALPYGDMGMAFAEPWMIALSFGVAATAATAAVYRILSRKSHDPIWLLPSAFLVASPLLLIVSFSAEGGTLGQALLLIVVGGLPWFALLLEVVLTRDPHRPWRERLDAAVKSLALAGTLGLGAVGLNHGHLDRAIAADLAGLEPLVEAIDAFLLDRRTAPEQLDELVPKYLDALPDEDFGGRLRGGPRYTRDARDPRVWQLTLELDEPGGGHLSHWVYVRRSDADLAAGLADHPVGQDNIETFEGWWRAPVVRSIWGEAWRSVP